MNKRIIIFLLLIDAAGALSIGWIKHHFAGDEIAMQQNMFEDSQ